MIIIVYYFYCYILQSPLNYAISSGPFLMNEVNKLVNEGYKCGELMNVLKLLTINLYEEWMKEKCIIHTELNILLNKAVHCVCSARVYEIWNINYKRMGRKISMTTGWNIWMICLELNWFFTILV